MDAKVQIMPQTLPQGRVFISYSRKDMAFVDRLEEALKMRNFEPIIDRAEIYAFEDRWKRIEALIEQRRHYHLRAVAPCRRFRGRVKRGCARGVA